MKSLAGLELSAAAIYIPFMNKRSRSTKLIFLLGAAALASLLVAAIAAALPGDPPIATLSPADNAAVPAVAEGLKVGFSCPAYRSAEEVIETEVKNEEEEIEIEKETVTTLGGNEAYGVHFANSPALGSDGRLSTAGFGEAGEGEAEVVKGTPNCTSELELPTTLNPAVLYSGRVYWQAYRECEGCETGYETSPVRSFLVVPTVPEAEINFENHLFGGYLTKVAFTSGAELKGTTVQLQEWSGTGWTTIATEPGNNSFVNSFFVKFQPGRRLLRPVVVGNGVTVALEEKARVVRKAKGGPSPAVKSGTWEVVGTATTREEEPLTFKVTAGGTMLAGLTGYAEAVCRGATKAEDVTIESTAAVHKARIAPDGSVAAVSYSTGATPAAVYLTGSFFEGHFTGEINSNFANCAGFRQFEATLAPPKKK
jgi:hypothetical protein